MTVEELEIIVTAKVEEAIKQFKKIVPEIRKAVEQAQESFEKMDTKSLKNKVQQAVQFVKKKIQDLKKSNQNNEIKLKVNNKDAQKQISQIQKEIDSLQQKINARQMKLNITNNALDKMRAETNQKVINDMPNAGNKAIKQETYNRLDSNIQYNSLVKESDRLNNEVMKYNSLLEIAKQEMSNLGNETQRTVTIQSKLSSFFSVLKPIISKVTNECQKISKSFFNLINPLNYVKKIVGGISNKIKGMGKGVKTGLKQVIKYAGALFSLKSIYTTLSSSASNWLSSQNAGAKQLSANIEYMKNSLGSVLAPAIQWITNLLYNMMKAVQSVVYALFRVNIFANASSKAYSNMAGSAKKAKKESQSLASIHSELNNISDNDNSDSGSGSGKIAPSFDLAQMDSQMSPIAQKLYNFFKPLKESWENYSNRLIEQVKTTAGQVGGLIASVWGSFENIITNGTIYKTLENILAIIGNIAENFSNAWNYNGNGDAIIQNLANALNNLLGVLNNVVKSEEFQNWLNNCSDKFRAISEKIAEINWQPLIDALTSIGQNLGNIALDILSGLVDIFKWLVENPIIAEIITAIAIAIGIFAGSVNLIVKAVEIYNAIIPIATAVSTALGISVGWLIGIVVAIIAVIALVVLAIMNWDTIMEWLRQTVETVINTVVEFFTNLWNQVSFIFEAIWNVISTVLSFIWNIFKTVFEAIWNIVSPIINAIWQVVSTIFQAIWNILSSILNSIWNIFSQIFNWIWQLISKVFQGIWNIISPIINKVWETIKFVLGKIQEIWSTVWNTISKVVNSVWNGIWSGIKTVINLILGGIESFVNGTIKGINKLLGGISSVANAVGSLIGLDPINLQISTISLPRLAKGGVLTQPTTVLAGEYAGARSNPEIVTPQNIMYDTMRRAIEDTEFHNSNNGQTINLTVRVGDKKLGDILLDELGDRKRRTGKDIEALVGG